MKTNAIIRIVLFSLTIIVLVGILLSGMGLFTNRRNSESVYTSEEITTDTLSTAAAVDTAGIRKLEIEWVAGDITIEPRDGIEQIQFSETAPADSKYNMYYKTSGSKLTIQFCKDSITDFSFGITFNSNLSKDLTIYVPQDWFLQELQLEVASTDVEVRNLTIGTIDFDGASGTCDFTNCIVNELDMDTASGDVTFSGELDSLDFDAASASFRGILNNCPREIDMDSMSGDLELALPSDCGFTVSMDGLSSNFRSEFSYSEKRNGTYVSGDGTCRIDVDGMSCDVYISKNTAA